MDKGQTLPPADVTGWAERLLPLREMIIGNLVLLGEIPAPTFREAARTREYIHRLIDSGVPHCAVDAVGNGVGILAGEEGRASVLLAASADSVIDASHDHGIAVQPDRVSGAGVGDSLGIGVLASLPLVFERLGLRFRDNLVLLAAARGAGRGNLEGIRYFLKNQRAPLRYGICLKGTPLGRLSYTSIGMLRGEIVCTVPAEYDWTRFGASGAVLTVNQIISSIAAIPLPRKPVISIVLGSIEGGNTYDRIARQVSLKFEIRGEDAATVKRVGERIADIVAETEAQSGADIDLDIFAQREPGGIEIGHPLVKTCRGMLDRLGIPPRIMPSTSETSALIDAGLPAVTLGLTRGNSLTDEREEIEIAPILLGIAQVIGVLQQLDGGWE
jgi:hypothetical protein